MMRYTNRRILYFTLLYLRRLQLSSMKEHLKLRAWTSDIRLLHCCLLSKLGKIWTSSDYTYHKRYNSLCEQTNIINHGSNII